jgi:glycerophosphoryl diester phosphodiesterase
MPPEQSTTTFIRGEHGRKTAPKAQKSEACPRAPAQHQPSLPVSGALFCRVVALPLLIAHRGAAAEAPENTLAAFERALALGADGIELDVRVTRDSTPVVFHDPTLARLTGRRRAIASLALRDLRAARIRGEPVPTLAEALDLIGGRTVVQIEIKAAAALAPAVRAVRQARATRHVILASFEAAVVAEARALAPGIPRMLISQGETAENLGPTLAGLAAAGVSIDHRAIPSPAFVAALQRCHYRVWCWTVNRPRPMLRLAAWGVDAILSDDPALLKSTLRSASPESARRRPRPPAFPSS